MIIYIDYIQIQYSLTSLWTRLRENVIVLWTTKVTDVVVILKVAEEVVVDVVGHVEHKGVTTLPESTQATTSGHPKNYNQDILY